jgi:hypothetical protein
MAMKGMERPKILALACGLLLVSKLAPADTRRYVTGTTELPESVVARTKAHIAEVVGKRAMLKNYQLSEERSSTVYVDGASEPAEYSVVFRYFPLARLGAEDAIVVLRVPVQSSVKVAGCVAPIDSTNRPRELRISDKEARAILSRTRVAQFAVDAPLSLERPWSDSCDAPWTWRLEGAKVSAPQECVAGLVDVSTGEVSWNATSCATR